MRFQLVIAGGATIALVATSVLAAADVHQGLTPEPVQCGQALPDSIVYRPTGCEPDLLDAVVEEPRYGSGAIAVYVPLRSPKAEHDRLLVLRSTDPELLEWAESGGADGFARMLERVRGATREVARPSSISDDDSGSAFDLQGALELHDDVKLVVVEAEPGSAWWVPPAAFLGASLVPALGVALVLRTASRRRRQ